MAVQIVNNTNTGLGVRIALGTSDSLLVGQAGYIASQETSGGTVVGLGSDNHVQVAGVIMGGGSCIMLGVNDSLYNGARVSILASGSVSGSNTGIEIHGNTTLVKNFGLISADFYGVVFDGSGGDGSYLSNSGKIDAIYAVVHGGTEGLSILNSGRISGLLGAIVGSTSADNVVNTGVIDGIIDLGGGNDSYDGRGGTLLGQGVSGNDGNDTFKMGAGVESVNGGNGTDVLDFGSTSGVRVALDYGFANSGTATGDRYTSIETVRGSDGGADILRGAARNEWLDGSGGNDKLYGMAGNDTLEGGAGIDAMNGGLGNDTFRFYSKSEAGDKISDFGNVTNNNDRFHIDASSFGGGLMAGVLAGSKFQSRADNHAQDSGDRFIFRTTDKTLWFDSNGNAAGGLTMVADLQAGAVVTAGDIILV